MLGLYLQFGGLKNRGSTAVLGLNGIFPLICKTGVQRTSRFFFQSSPFKRSSTHINVTFTASSSQCYPLTQGIWRDCWEEGWDPELAPAIPHSEGRVRKCQRPWDFNCLPVSNRFPYLGGQGKQNQCCIVALVTLAKHARTSGREPEGREQWA